MAQRSTKGKSKIAKVMREKKHGTLTAAELSQAERELGVGAPKKSRR